MSAYPDWRDDAACRGLPGDLFFGADDEGPAARVMREHRARAVCARCPVTGPAGPCAAWALATGDMWSVSGGMNPAERTALKRAAARVTQGRRQRAAVEADGEKVCTRCGPPAKPLSEFGREGPGYRGNCKTCRNSMVRQHRAVAS